MKKLVILFCLAGLHTRAAETDSAATQAKLAPALVFSSGIINFIGDVGYSHLNEPLFNRHGYQFSLQWASRSMLSPSIYYLTGVTSGNEKSLVRNVNFRTTLSAFGVQLKINFTSRTRSDQVLVPYLAGGVEYLSFTPKGDLLDARGEQYYYWDNGLIKNIDESSPNSGNASTIYRDYEYETNLRDANLDSLGNYKTSCLAFTGGIGLRLNLSARCAVSFSSVCHFTSSDYLDNITAESKGSRKGDSKNDKFIYSSASFSYDFSAPRETARKKRLRDKDFKNIDFKQLAKDDTDGDGIPDISDESPGTPSGVKVDDKGRPVDTDLDGIADYVDKEPNSLPGALVNEEGITLTDRMIEEKFRQDSLSALPTIKEYLKSTGTPGAPGRQPLPIPSEFTKVDTDGNGVISAKEIGDSIDAFLAGNSPYNTDQFYKLVDFYFSQ